MSEQKKEMYNQDHEYHHEHNDHEYHHEHHHEHNDHEHHHDHNHHEHHHVHSEEEKRAVMNRLAKAIGHLESIRKMVERDEDCSDILIQLAAVRSAVHNTGKLVLKNHLNHCIVEAVEEKDYETIEKLNEAIDKFMK